MNYQFSEKIKKTVTVEKLDVYQHKIFGQQ